MRLAPAQVELKEANAFVERLHRHHKPVMGHRFSLGVQDADGALHGVAIVGRPVARACNHHEVLEVTRLVTDGTKNACSFLYSAAARVGRELGYLQIQTYVLESEPGTSLRAAGWDFDGLTAKRARQWTGTNDKPRRQDQPTEPKQRWVRTLGNRRKVDADA